MELNAQRYRRETQRIHAARGGNGDMNRQATIGEEADRERER